ncbi:hypothetical protein KGQ19_12605 [Catenulispora sp. NL8]|uniref:DUF1023 domain-containing protein n=1 Tax=Catenulispora pinistramenti TaxID=2705254 RepID=A0ABS5KNT0_9ACTN|nr:alpha/beta hydrolase [Catenulispora pinistramenti]MBS2547708.1 hypothetical protein [Catenulispora pinistramenti]
MAYRYHSFANDVDQSWRGAVSLINDPAITTWMGRSGEAFREAAGPFPGMLDGAAKAYREVGDAFATFSGKIADIQSQIDLLATASLYDAEEMEVNSGLSQDAVQTLVAIPYRPELETRLDDYAGSSTLDHDAYKASYDKIAQSWLAIGNRRGDLVSLLSDLRDAKRIWMDTIRSATDSAHDITAQLGASGKSSGDFNERFAAFGGSVTDLVLAPQAAVDLDVAELPLPGADPSEIAAWWTSLSQAERDKLLNEHPDVIGSLDGIPCVDRDKANRILLAFQLQDAKTRLDALRATEPSKDTQGAQWDTWNDKVKALQDQYNGLQAISDRLYNHPDMPPAFLLGSDEQGLGHAIVAINNPDTANNVITYVPGTTARLGTIGNDIARSDKMVDSANDASNGTQATASITWVGYDAPQNIVTDSPLEGYAKDAEGKLLSFEVGLRTTHLGSPSLNTIIGHSYGTTAVGFTMRDHGLPVDRVIFVGSPGVGVDHASDLHIDPAHVWAGAAANDPVPQLNTYGDAVLLGIPIAGAYISWLNDEGSHGGWFGQNPAAAEFGGNILPTVSGKPVLDGGSHSQYWDTNSPSLKAIGQIAVGGNPHG